MGRVWLGLIWLVISAIDRTDGQNPPGFTSTGVNKIASPPGAASPAAPEDPQLRACVKKHVQTNPAIRQRYTDTVIRDMCRRSIEWQGMVGNTTTEQQAASLPSRSQFTQTQLAWLHSIYQCQNLSCICGPGNASSPQCAQTGTRDRLRKRQTLVVDNTLQDRAGRAQRREIRQMSDDERNRYFRALNSLKFDQVDGMSKYDLLVLYHTPEYAPEAHFSAALLPYHREFLKNFELALRMVDQSLALPYWDTTLDAPLPNPAESVLWTPEFFGNGLGDVTTGPFGNWFAVRDSQANPSPSGRITRSTGTQGSLLNDNDINTILGKTRFRDLVFCVDPFAETAHGASHMWVGGHMLTLRISPNDPVFYNFHAFVDLIWEQWRLSRQNINQRETDYVLDNEACNRVSTFNSRMLPFPVNIGAGLSNRYTQVFYTYSNRPQCPNCGSAYLFCDTRQNKCLSKIRPGGNCRGYEGFDSCFNSRCGNGQCSGRGSGGGNDNPPARENTNVCRNNHACCTYWASVGECNRNPTWMRESCGVACGVCRGSGCGDSYPRCSSWAAEGECQSNSEWMPANCPFSCGTCNANFGANECQIGGGGSDNRGCRNSEGRCSRWAREGECRSNADWMLPNCALACNSCS